MNKIPVSVNVLTRNSEVGLQALLPTLNSFDEILLIDGNSTDATLDLANQYNCTVIKQEDTKELAVVIKDFSVVRNKGIQYSKNDWILKVDSDEYIDDKLAEEVRSLVQGDIYTVYKVPRKFVYNNRKIDVSPGYPNMQIILFNRLAGITYAKPVHEKPVFDKSKIKIAITKNCIYVPLEDYDQVVAKGQKYLDMYFQDLAPINLKKWLRYYLYFYLRGDLSFAWRYFKTLFKKGYRMPLRHDAYIILYHDQMIRRSFKKMLEYYFKK